MKKNHYSATEYVAPKVTVDNYVVEQGFALSPYVGEDPGKTGTLEGGPSNDFDI